MLDIWVSSVYEGRGILQVSSFSDGNENEHQKMFMYRSLSELCYWRLCFVSWNGWKFPNCGVSDDFVEWYKTNCKTCKDKEIQSFKISRFLKISVN